MYIVTLSGHPEILPDETRLRLDTGEKLFQYSEEACNEVMRAFRLALTLLDNADIENTSFCSDRHAATIVFKNGKLLHWERFRADPADEPRDMPMTAEEIEAQYNAEGSNGFIHGVVKVSVADLIDNNLEGVLDIFSEKLTGGVLLTEIDADVVGHDEDALYFRVKGNAEDIIKEFD